MSDLWNSITSLFADALGALQGVLDATFGEHAWGWAIIALTLIVRVLLLPLAIKQTRSMRAMQALQPKVKKLQEKHKVDRELLKKNPEKYREKKQRLNEEMMALYKEEGVNPASGCLPLIAQAPIFFALFSVLQSPDAPLVDEPFYFFTTEISADATFQGLGANVNQAGWPGWLLLLLMVATMFWTQRQMMARSNAEGTQAQQQKIMMYVMPVFLAFIGQTLPLGVLLYWVTTNVWQLAQQTVILREVREGGDGGKNGAKRTEDPDGGSDRGVTGKGRDRAPSADDRSSRGTNRPKAPPSKTPKTSTTKRDHLPKRTSRQDAPTRSNKR